jgi:hypothetical protein
MGVMGFERRVKVIGRTGGSAAAGGFLLKKKTSEKQFEVGVSVKASPLA